jgi:hypothetical protein
VISTIHHPPIEAAPAELTPPRQGQASPHKVTYRLITDDSTVAMRAPVRDVTPAGMALLAEAPIEAGKVLLVMLHHDLPVQIARVRYAVNSGKGQWSIGCSFARRLTDGELHTILAD